MQRPYIDAHNIFLNFTTELGIPFALVFFISWWTTAVKTVINAAKSKKAYFKEFLLSCVLSAKRCPKCGHPMMANINGLNGIACPDCGYAPYVTLIAFCECGDFEVVKTQPELNDEKIFNYLNDFFNNKNDTHCESCNRDLMDDYVAERIMLVPIPIPYDEYKNIDVIYKNSKY
jgi:DNA-directed RNA polymerase subunit RPC12/RpoP